MKIVGSLNNISEALKIKLFEIWASYVILGLVNVQRKNKIFKM